MAGEVAQIGPNEIPAAVLNKGRYVLDVPELLGYNGLEQPIHRPFYKLTWTFTELTEDEWSFWVMTVLEAKPSKMFDSLFLYGVAPLRSLMWFDSGVVFRPTYEALYNNTFQNVVVFIDRLHLGGS